MKDIYQQETSSLNEDRIKMYHFLNIRQKNFFFGFECVQMFTLYKYIYIVLQFPTHVRFLKLDWKESICVTAFLKYQENIFHSR